MIDTSRRLLSTAAAMLFVVTLTGAGGSTEAVTEPPADAPAAASADDPTEVGWRLLASLNYRTGEPSEELAALSGKLVKIPGFTVPLEDWASSATEFLLVPYVGACIHTPPPPPNQLVYIEMDEGKRAKLDGWNPVWVEGVLTIEMTESVYGYVGFTLSGQQVYPYES
ncbi:DUF3299 domain-containing protein [Candidatus Palauibacter sp.]|uniref:DUF3299 domain-containing protein n=1 Tax=Candidatus Palauibacter sp. TaxID=3101350 RepID=UPI003D0A924C